MESKTPKFDSLLDEVFEKLVPRTRVCKWKGKHKYCEGEFEIEEGDITFLKTLRVPPPNFCPTCRRIRRFGYVGILNLFKISCSAPNHNEKVISIFPEECPFPVYDYKYFIGDEFDPLTFGLNIENITNITKDFFNLRKVFPVPSFLNRDPLSINSEYSNGGRDTKNVYYAGGCFHSENVWYSSLVNKSKDIMDSRDINKSEYLYRSVVSDYVYKSAFVFFSKNCTDSMFLFDCKNVDNCFGCVGLRNAKYYVWNKQLTKNEYQEFIQSIYPLSINNLEKYKEEFWNLVKSFPIDSAMNISTINGYGVSLENCKDVFDVSTAENASNLRHSEGCLSHSDSMDVTFSGGKSNHLYNVANVGSQSSNVKFSVYCKFCTNSEFIFNCKNVDNCFMCFGLQDKSYCILNKQYSKEEYYKILDEIKFEMMNNGEYGDGCGLEFSPMPYNFSHGQISFPMEDREILELGGYVAEESESNSGEIKIFLSGEIPQTIDEVSDDILNVAIQCKISEKPFRIIKSELEFYRKMKLPLPIIHPSLRIKELFSFLPLGRSYGTSCQKCNSNILSLFNPKDGYKLYCEKCYQNEVY